MITNVWHRNGCDRCRDRAFRRREPTSDRLEDTLHYDLIRGSILEIAGSQHFDLQETLARRLFDSLSALPGVLAVRVRTAKPDAYEDCRQIAYELSNLA